MKNLSKLKDDCVDRWLTSKPSLKHSIHKKKDINGRARVLQYTILFLRLLSLIGHKVLLLEIYLKCHVLILPFDAGVPVIAVLSGDVTASFLGVIYSSLVCWKCCGDCVFHHSRKTMSDDGDAHHLESSISACWFSFWNYKHTGIIQYLGQMCMLIRFFLA